jgi:hypothetical protein
LKSQLEEDTRERGPLPYLTEDEVLAWADAFFARTGDWPTRESGPIPESPGESWRAVETALVLGIRGFSPGGTLPRFFAQHRGRYNQSDQHFSIRQILAWAEEWRARTGRGPIADSGDIPGAGGISWSTLDHALRRGLGGLPGGSSLFHLLTGQRRAHPETPLTSEHILAWADAHHARTGAWPDPRSGPISEAPDHTWGTVDAALRRGFHGLSGGSSLIHLFVKERGVRSAGYAPPLTELLILAWADAFHLRTGRWPTETSGPLEEAPGENWSLLSAALQQGTRELPGGSSLARMLARERGVRNLKRLAPMTFLEILRWADLYHDRHGTWPDFTSGPIPEAPGETWLRVHGALLRGGRGLPRGATLKRLLWEHRGVRFARARVPFTVEGILAWADAHRARTGTWPDKHSGPIPESPGVSWRVVEIALTSGGHGLPGGSSVSRLLVERRAVRHRNYLPDLTIPQIRAWAEAFRARTGQWPARRSGPILEAPGESWRKIERVLQSGGRGLSGGLSLRCLRDTAKHPECQTDPAYQTH